MRYLHQRLSLDLEKHMVLLSGPRQCGKTTYSKWLLNQKISASQEGVYLNWDQLKDRPRIQKQQWPDHTKILVLDEVHKRKSWKNFLKGIYDTKVDELKMLVTGSARMDFFRKSGDSMFGRFRSWRLHPFCNLEDPLQLPSSKKWERLLQRGGFPFPYLSASEEEAARWRSQRWSSLLREDLRDLESVRDVGAIELLAELLKGYAAQMVSFQNLAEDVEVSPKTVRRWVEILEKLYLVTLVSPYSRTIKRSLSKTPKLYFSDPGDLLEQPWGARVENLVANLFLKRIHFLEDAFGDRYGLHYLRDKEGNEVDFLLTLNHKPVLLIEVKAQDSSVHPGLYHFGKQLPGVHRIQLLWSGSSFTKQGIQVMTVEEFFSKPFEDRRFWQG